MSAHTLGLSTALAIPLAFLYAVVLGWEFFRLGLWVSHGILHLNLDEEPCSQANHGVILHASICAVLTFVAVFLMVVGIR